MTKSLISSPIPPTNGRQINEPSSSSSISTSTAPINEPITLISGTTTQIPSHLASTSLRISITSFSLGILFGLTFYFSTTLFNQQSRDIAFQTGWDFIHHLKQLDFGNLKGYHQNEVENSFWNPFLKPQFNFYLLSWSSFHLLEFIITAKFNPTRLHVDSFLLQNGISYHLAHLLGITEFLIESHFFPSMKSINYLTYVGVLVLLIGQFIRSLAMIHASGNFSHTVAWKKRGDHELVKDGIYSLTRHPSYLGFFYWALSTQILLSNPLSFFIFMIVLWRFFNHRIRVEEEYLVEFFGKDYIEYRKKVGTLLPFIK